MFFEIDINTAGNQRTQAHFLVFRIIGDAAAAITQCVKHGLLVITYAGNNTDTGDNNAFHNYLVKTIWCCIATL